MKSSNFRVLSKEEREGVTSYLSKLMTCDITDLYPLGLRFKFLKMSSSTRHLLKCMPPHIPCSLTDSVGECRAISLDERFAQKCHEILHKAEECWLGKIIHECPLENQMTRCFGIRSFVSLSCFEKFETHCRSYKIRATKLIRLSMQNVEDVIKTIPDIYIVFYIRDPRAIWLSRKKGGRNLPIGSLCDQMLDDYKLYQILLEKYPGVFIKVKYEELAENPVTTAEKIYNHFGKELPLTVNAHLKDITQSKNNIEHPMRVHRKDSNSTAHAWRHSISVDDLQLAVKGCSNYLLTAGYEI